MVERGEKKDGKERQKGAKKESAPERGRFARGGRLTRCERRKLMEARCWTTYELAEKAGLTQSTVSNLFRASAIPTIPTLEKICSAFGITLSDFFEEDSQSRETMILVHKINRLTENRKNLTKAIIDEFEEK